MAHWSRLADSISSSWHAAQCIRTKKLVFGSTGTGWLIAVDARVGSLQQIWRLIAGYIETHCRRSGDSLSEMWGLIAGDVGTHCRRCEDSLPEILGLIAGDGLAHCRRCGDSMPEMGWLISRNVVTQCRRWVGSLCHNVNSNRRERN